MRTRLLLICLLLLAQVALAQEGWLYSPYAPISPEDAADFRRANEIRSYAFEESRDIYLRLANENPGTALGGDSLIAAMYVQILRSDPVGVEATRQRLLTEYPRSRYEVFAKLYELDLRLSRLSNDAAIAEYSDFLESYGAPRLEGIMAGQGLDAATMQVLNLPFEIRMELAKVYYTGVALAGPGVRRINVAKFGHQAFGTTISPHMTFDSQIQSAIGEATGKTGLIGLESARPKLTVVSPTQNSTVGTQPIISFRASSGDYRYSQVSLLSLSVKLDGAEQKNKAVIRTDINESLAEGVDFEVLTFTLSPILAPGVHTVEVMADTGTPDTATTITWSFTVSENPSPNPNPTTQTLNSTKDSILSQQNPHRNEGANPLLQLSHRPEERNKSNNPIVAFDMSGVNVTRVTKATLVLDVQECELPKKWGPEGRNILAYPINETWVEGNGQTIKVGQKEQTRGSGQGVTWFSPVDTNIANKAPNGALQWMGARPFLGPLTAPPLLVVNKQTGQIKFDVTQDVRSGFDDGWLLRKQDESAFGNIRFHSKERGATLGPRLILEYGPVAAKDTSFRKLALGHRASIAGLSQIWAGVSLGSLNPLFQLGQAASWTLAVTSQDWSSRPLSYVARASG